MRALLLALLLSAAALAQPAWDTRVDVPDGIRYKPTSSAANRTAYNRIKSVLTAKGAEHIFGTTISIVGPSLWQRYQSILKGGVPVTFKVPNRGETLQAQGRGFHKSAAERDALEEALRQDVAHDGGLTGVRKALPRELQVLWAIYPSDLQEPIFVAETAHHKFCFVFEGVDAMLVEDFS